MRVLVGIFGGICGLVVIGLVSRYGYKSTDIEADAWIMAFLFGVIAAGGLFGHAVAVRLWRHSRLAAVVCGLICAVALVINLSNSLGAIAGRADSTTTGRIKKNTQIRDDTAELARLERQRDSLPTFVPTDDEAVRAARRQRIRQQAPGPLSVGMAILSSAARTVGTERPTRKPRWKGLRPSQTTRRRPIQL
jgi:MFS family permease